MYSKGAIFIFCATVAAIVLSCASALYQPFPGQETPSATLAELQAGRKIYISKCSGCHNLYLPERYTKQEWSHWIDKMSNHAPLDSAERELALKYLGKGR